MMTIGMLLQIINEAQARIDDRSLPMKVRINSRETVSLCETRAEIEGWKIDRNRATGVWGLIK
ncbi:TPA: hypothetical protein ACOVJJ_001243 [Klebsiella oxytoca]